MRGDVTDSGIMRVLSKICDIVCLNVLWLVCSLPIITIGASTTALYTVMLKLVKNEEGYIFKGFLHAFKLNFKQSTIIWLILLLCGGVCFVDYRISEMMPGTLGMVFKSVFFLPVQIIFPSYSSISFLSSSSPPSAFSSNTRNTLLNIQELIKARIPVPAKIQTGIVSIRIPVFHHDKTTAPTVSAVIKIV